MSTARRRLENPHDLEQLRKQAIAEQEHTTHSVRVCLGTGCMAKGAAKVFAKRVYM